VLTKLEEERRREDWIAPDNSFRVLEVIAGSYSGGKRAKGRERERERERGGGEEGSHRCEARRGASLFQRRARDKFRGSREQDLTAASRKKHDDE
jgi:hypothetical protein